MPSSSRSGVFRWIRDLFRALLDLIYPQRQRKKQNRKKASVNMAKKLVLSTGYVFLFAILV